MKLRACKNAIIEADFNKFVGLDEFTCSIFVESVQDK